MMDSREPPKKMLELLNEFISEQGIENEYNPQALLNELELVKEREMKMPRSEGKKYNPYR